MIQNYALFLEQKKFKTINEDTPDNQYYDPTKDPANAANQQTQNPNSSAPAGSEELKKVFDEVMGGIRGSAEQQSLQTAIGTKIDLANISQPVDIDNVEFTDSKGDRNLVAKLKVSPIAGTNKVKLEVKSVEHMFGQTHKATDADLKGISGKLVGLKKNPGIIDGRAKVLQTLISAANPQAAALIKGKGGIDGRYGDVTASALGLVVNGNQGQPINEVTQQVLDTLLAAVMKAGGNVDMNQLQTYLNSGSQNSPKTGQPGAGGAGQAASTGTKLGGAPVAGKTLNDSQVLDIATQLKNQISGVAWDETDKIKKILEPIKSQADLDAVRDTYEKITGNNLIDDLDGEYSIDPSSVQKFLQGKGLLLKDAKGNRSYSRYYSQPNTTSPTAKK